MAHSNNGRNCSGAYFTFTFFVLLTFAASCTSAKMLSAIYFCSTAQPIGLSFSDTGKNVKRRLNYNPIQQFVVGSKGYCATAYESKIDIYHFGKHNCVFWRTEPSLIGWNHDLLLFSSRSKLYYFDAVSRRVTYSHLSPSVIALQQFNQGILTIEQQNHQLILRQYNRANKQVRLWKTYGVLQQSRIIIVGDRYSVIEFSDSQKKKFGFWIIDTRSDNQKFFSLGDTTMGFCTGNAPLEILASTSTGYDSTHRVAASNFIAISCRTLQQRTLFQKKGQYNLVGRTFDGEWIFTMRPYAEVGPCALLAVKIKNGQEHIMQENVYDCFLTAK